MSVAIQPIPTRYAGHLFRSRLEARWAVFFDAVGAGWEYEPQGYRLPGFTRMNEDSGHKVDGGMYLPDFLLTDCGVWVEVKGSSDALNVDLMRVAARQLPRQPRSCGGTKLLILGPIPALPSVGDWGWMALQSCPDCPSPDDAAVEDATRGDCARCNGDGAVIDYPLGFGSYAKNNRPWSLFNATMGDNWLKPCIDPYESTTPAYAAARSARFEHGEVGAR